MTKAKAKKKAKRQTLLIEGKVEDQPQANERRPLDAAAFEDCCDHIASGNSLRSWAEKTGYSVQAVHQWVMRDEDRRKQYREARRLQADAHVDQLIDLADEAVPCDDTGRIDSGAVNQLRLRVDTRKWIASKYHPAMYADKVQVEDVTPPGREQKPEEVMERIAALLAAHGLRITPADPEP